MRAGANNYAAWTEEEERLLGGRPDREIAEMLGRTVRAVESQRHRLGILRQPSIRLKLRPWKRAKIALLGTMPDRELAVRLRRSTGSVSTQRRKLGIAAFDQRRSVNGRKAYPLKPWTAAETALLGTMSDGKAASRIGRSEASVRARRKQLGLPALGRRS